MFSTHLANIWIEKSLGPPDPSSKYLQQCQEKPVPIPIPAIPERMKHFAAIRKPDVGLITVLPLII